MRPTTVTTCEDNVPRTQLFLDEKSLNSTLQEHYEQVWAEVEAEGDIPGTWDQIRKELAERDLLRDRHIAHIQHHDLFAA